MSTMIAFYMALFNQHHVCEITHIALYFYSLVFIQMWYSIEWRYHDLISYCTAKLKFWLLDILGYMNISIMTIKVPVT
jgi:hypothetical protein